MKWLNLISGGYASLIVDGLIVLAVVAAFGWTYHYGYSSAAATWSLKYDQRDVAITKAYNTEVSRQAQANAMAKAQEAKRLDEMAAENAALEQKIKDQEDAANADPDRDRVCLSDGSGLRIDSIH